jgi:hypothetical protein
MGFMYSAAQGGVFSDMHHEVALLYDASSGHHKYNEDALVATRMRRTPGGSQPKMRETRVPEDELGEYHTLDPYMENGEMVADERGIFLFRQSMVFEEGDYVYATGERTILQKDPSNGMYKEASTQVL